ncbi:MAG: DUF490 domain-containing protein [Paracoccus denitrificans]|nr:MAG: DUF490 domain-containing protein [Paracoccus denitrificans]PZO85818.1 MAG: DUF490 domain-containing protein [Paracoccus denitrificans]
MIKRFLSAAAVSFSLALPCAGFAQDTPPAPETAPANAPAAEGGGRGIGELAELSASVDDDRGFITRLLERNLSDAGRKVEITGFQGALSSRATFETITITDDQGVWITLRNGAIQWNRAALFARRIDIQELSAQEIDLPRMPAPVATTTTPEATPFQLPQLPVAVNIANISAQRVKLGQPVIGEAAEVSVAGSMNLAGGEGTAQLAINRVDDKRGQFALDAAFSNATRVLKLDLSLDEDRDGLFANIVKLYDRPAVKAQITGEGPLSDFAANIKLATDGQDRITGVVSAKAQPGANGTPGTGFHAEVTGDVASLLPPENRAFFGARAQLLAEGWRGENGAVSLPVLMVDTDALKLTGSVTTTDKGAPQSVVMLLTLGQDAGASQVPVRLPTGGTATEVTSGSLQISYDASQGDGWSLNGRVGNLTQGGNRIGALTLNGGGTITLADGALQKMDGNITFGGQNVALADAGLQQAIGANVSGQTNFEFMPGNALRVTNLAMNGEDYRVTGDVIANGLQSGITLNLDLNAAYENLARLSTLAGRKMAGSANAKLTGSYTVLSRGFDLEAQANGVDISVDQEQADRLLGGNSTINLSARRDETGINLRQLSVNARRLNLSAQGMIATDSADVRANLKMSSLTDADPSMAGAIEAEATLTGASGARRLTLNGNAQDLVVGIKELDGALKGRTDIAAILGQQRGGYSIETLRLANPQLSVDGQGIIARDALDARLDINVPQLAVLGRDWSGSLNAQATARQEEDGTRVLDLTGKGQDLRIGLAQADGALTGTTDLSVSAAEKDGIFNIRRATLSNPQVNGDVSGIWGPNVTDITGKLAVTSLAAIQQDWQGALNIQGTVADDGQGVRRFDLTGTGDNLRFGQAQADSALTGTTNLAVRGTQQGQSFTIEEGSLTNNQTQITAQGTYAPGNTNLTAHANVGDLAPLGLGWRGGINADATYRDDGTGARRLQVDGVGRDLSFGQQNVDSALAGETRLTVRGNERGGLFTIEQATIANPRLNAEASGTIVQGGTDVTARIEAGNLGFLGNNIRGALNAQGRLVERDGQRHVSAQGTANGLGIGNDRIDPLLAGQTTFDLAAHQGPQGIAVERLIARNGQVNITADGNPQGAMNLNASLSDLGLVVPGFPGPVTARGTLRDEGQAYAVDVAVTAPGGTRAQIAGTAAKNGQTTDLRLSGISDAAVANPFLRVRSVSGAVEFDLRMQGPPSLDALTGQVRLPNMQLSDPKLGLRVENLSATANLERGLINIDAAGSVQGGGRLSVTGPIDLRGASPRLDLRVGLDGVVMRDPNLYQTVAYGEVTVSGVASEGPLIAGTIELGETEFRIPSTGMGGARAIPPITHLHERPPTRATRAKAGLLPFPSADSRIAGMTSPAATPPTNPARLNVTINAPNQVFIRGRGVDAEMGGSIQITGRANNVVPVGQLELIRGRVDLLGKRFDMTEGLIELQGSLVPVLRLVAETTQDTITTRIIIDGEARDPDITFESSPELPEEEVVSHLLFGRGLDNISALQAAQLANALAVLAGRGGEGIVSRIRESTGLDDLDLATDDEGNVSVRAGKYLSRNVYTDVAVDNEGKSKINLNLDVTPALTARGSVGSDGDSSIGLFYERDY